jgi:hypothetical protein
MAQSFYPITPVNVTPGTAGSWQDVDCSSYIADGASGVILHFVNAGGVARVMAGRKNGSSDNRISGADSGNHAWGMYGVDASRLFEAYVGDLTDVQVWLVGYTTSGVTYKLNGVSKTLGVNNTWTDIDCAADCPSATGIIFDQANWGYYMGLRCNGSTDDRYEFVNAPNDIQSAIVKCDGSQLIEARVNDYTSVTWYITGYVTDGVTWNINATDLSLGSTGSYYDLTALGTGAKMGIIEVNNLGEVWGAVYALRKNGSAEDINQGVLMHTWAVVECDTSYLIEGEISNTAIDFFLIGYAIEDTTETIINMMPLGWGGNTT